MRLRQLIKFKFNPLVEAALLAASCLWGSQANAQSYLSPGYVMGEIRDGLGLVKPEAAPDFVVRGRPDPATLEYAPLKPPPRNFHDLANKPKEKLEVEAKAIAELEAARMSLKARAVGKASANSTLKSVVVPQEEDPVPMKWNAWDTE